jgi:hypothetical protein
MRIIMIPLNKRTAPGTKVNKTADDRMCVFLPPLVRVPIRSAKTKSEVALNIWIEYHYVFYACLPLSKNFL